MQINLSDGRLSAQIQCNDDINFNRVVQTASRELQKIQQNTSDRFRGGPSGMILLGKGDVAVQLQADESTEYSDFVSSLHNEAAYFADNCVFLDEADRIDQHIHHRGER